MPSFRLFTIEVCFPTQACGSRHAFGFRVGLMFNGWLGFVAKPKLYSEATLFHRRTHTHIIAHRYQRSRSAQTARKLFLSKIASIGYWLATLYFSAMRGNIAVFEVTKPHCLYIERRADAGARATFIPSHSLSLIQINDYIYIYIYMK